MVQDPEDAAFSEMPLMALNRSMPHHVVHLDEMPGLLDKLAHHPAGEAMFCPESMKFEVEVAKGARAGMKDMDKIGRRSVLTCPDCNGVMWEIDADADVHYRCHVGHAYSAETMNLALDDNLCRALLRALEERVAPTEKLRNQAGQRGHKQTADLWARKKAEVEQEAEIVRKAILRADRIASAFATA